MKPVATQIIKKFHVLLLNQKVHYCVHKSPPILRPCVTFRNKLISYGGKFLVPCLTPTLQGDMLYKTQYQAHAWTPKFEEY